MASINKRIPSFIKGLWKLRNSQESFKKINQPKQVQITGRKLFLIEVLIAGDDIVLRLLKSCYQSKCNDAIILAFIKGGKN